MVYTDDVNESSVRSKNPGGRERVAGLANVEFEMEPERGRTFSPDSSDSETKNPLPNKETLALKS